MTIKRKRLILLQAKRGLFQALGRCVHREQCPQLREEEESPRYEQNGQQTSSAIKSDGSTRQASASSNNPTVRTKHLQNIAKRPLRSLPHSRTLAPRPARTQSGLPHRSQRRLPLDTHGSAAVLYISNANTVLQTPWVHASAAGSLAGARPLCEGGALRAADQFQAPGSRGPTRNHDARP